MYKNKYNNRNNICGINIAKIRKEIKPKMSQRALAEKLQTIGIDVDKNAVQRIENGKRFVTDIELLAFSELFHIPIDQLLKIDNIPLAKSKS